MADIISRRIIFRPIYFSYGTGWCIEKNSFQFIYGKCAQAAQLSIGLSTNASNDSLDVQQRVWNGIAKKHDIALLYKVWRL